jgi:hypothetical protein
VKACVAARIKIGVRLKVVVALAPDILLGVLYEVHQNFSRNCVKAVILGLDADFARNSIQVWILSLELPTVREAGGRDASNTLTVLEPVGAEEFVESRTFETSRKRPHKVLAPFSNVVLKL